MDRRRAFLRLGSEWCWSYYGQVTAEFSPQMGPLHVILKALTMAQELLRTNFERYIGWEQKGRLNCLFWSRHGYLTWPLSSPPRFFILPVYTTDSNSSFYYLINRHLWEVTQRSLDRGSPNQSWSDHYVPWASMALTSAVSVYSLPRHQQNPYLHKEGITHQCARLNGSSYSMTGRPLTAHASADHQHYSHYHQALDITSSRPLTANTIRETLPQSMAHAAWQQQTCSMSGQPSVLLNRARYAYSSEEEDQLALDAPSSLFSPRRRL